MNQYCKTKRKTIVLQMDISGKTNQDQLYVAESDNDNDLENLGGDSDTEFIPVTEKAREALITSDNNIEVEDTTSTTGDVQRPSLDMENLEAVVHDTIAELSPVILLTKTATQNDVALSCHNVRGLYYLAVVFVGTIVLPHLAE